MKSILQPWRLLLCILAGWVHRQHQQVIQFRDEQIRALLQKLGKKRVLLSDDQRRRLAMKGKSAGTQGAERVDDDRHARHDSSLAPRVGGYEMGLQPAPPEKAWTSADLRGSRATCGSHCSFQIVWGSMSSLP